MADLGEIELRVLKKETTAGRCVLSVKGKGKLVNGQTGFEKVRSDRICPCCHQNYPAQWAGLSGVRGRGDPGSIRRAAITMSSYRGVA